MPRKKKIEDVAGEKPKRGRKPKAPVALATEPPVGVPSVAAQVDAANFVIVGPEIREGFVHLSRMDLLEFELRQSRVLAWQHKRKLMRYEIDEIRRQQDRALLDAEARLAFETREYLSYKKKLGETYDVDFDQATYDDSTGRLLIEGAPLLAPD